MKNDELQNGNELFIVPKKSEIYVGDIEKWSCLENSHHIENVTALFIGKDNEMTQVPAALCGSCNKIFIKSEDRLSLNIDFYSKFYNFLHDSDVQMVTNENTESMSILIKEEKEKKQKQKERAEFMQQERKIILSAKEISNMKLFDVDFCKNNLTAIKIKKGTIIEIVNNSSNHCKYLGHSIHKHVAILRNSNNEDIRVGYCYICKSCSKVYLETDLYEEFDIADFPGYSFSYKEIKLSIKELHKRLQINNKKRDWYRDLNYSVICSIKDIKDVTRRGLIPAIKLDECQIINIGGLHKHEHNQTVWRCAALLKNRDGKYKKVGLGIWCTKCQKFYFDSFASCMMIEKAYDNYTFEIERDTTILTNNLLQDQKIGVRLPLKTRDIHDTEGIVIKHGDDANHDKTHYVKKLKLHLIKDNGKAEIFSNVKYCFQCNTVYLPFELEESYLSSNFSKYKIIKGSNYEEQSAQFNRKLERRLQEEKAAKEKEEQLKKIRQIKNTPKNKTQENTEKNKNLDDEFEGDDKITSEDFLVRMGSFACRKNNHPIEEITACVTVVLPRGIRRDVFVPAWYCKKCRCYFISEYHYEQIKKLGIIVAQVYKESDWNKQHKYGFINDFKQESVLHAMGYNVNASENLSDYTRQSILSTAVDFKILTKRAIIDHLTSLIALRENNPSMENAIMKWERDLNFISEYQLNTRKFVRAQSITIK